MASILPHDSVEIRCICQYNHDDNFTIQCERCNAWQHARCLKIENEESIPDVYLCPECSGTLDAVDVKSAKYHQRQFVQRKTTIERALRAKNADGEEPKKRGRKKLSELAKLNKPESFFDSSYYNVPKTGHSWTTRAQKIWKNYCRDLPLVSPKELKNPPNLKIVENEEAKKEWKFGLSAAEVVSLGTITKGKFICEIVGEVRTINEYNEDKVNMFGKLGCPKRGVFCTPRLPLTVDCRRQGSKTEFLYRSSEPNARLVTARDDKDELRLLVYAKRSIKPNTTISLGWHWPKNHPIRARQNQGEHTQSEHTGEIGDNQIGENQVDQAEAEKIDATVRSILWALDVSQEECLACSSDSEDEVWDLTDSDFTANANHSEPSKPRNKPGRKPKTESLEAPADYIWREPQADIAPPTKKRLSLADYMKKRS